MWIQRLLFTSILLVYESFVNAEDPWNRAQEILRQAPKRYDPILKASGEDGASIMQGDNVLYIPMDYYEEEQEGRHSYFWDNIATDWQKEVYQLLIESSNNYNNPEATYTLAQLHLWGYYEFPHNKSMAFWYADKFNNMTNFTNSTVLFDLSIMYSTGFFGEIPIDSAKGLAFLQTSASLGNVHAKQALAYKYFTGTSVPRDCNKALILYRDISQNIRDSFSDEEWYVYPPHVESYNIRVSDFTGGLLGKGLSSMRITSRRVTSERPDVTSTFLTKMDDNKVWLKFGSQNSGSSFTNSDDETDDRIVDIFYTAWDEYRGTYSKARNCEQARYLLELAFETFDSEVPLMENLPRYYYAKCLDLLGHIYFTGEAEGYSNVTLAESYLKRSIEVLEKYGSIAPRSHIDLGLIAQYIDKNDTAAIQHYKVVEKAEYLDGRSDFQLSKLSMKYPELNLGDPFTLMQTAYLKGLRPAVYEYARMTESGVNDRYSCEDTAYLFKSFTEANEVIMAPQLRLAYGELLKENAEVALWAYAQAAEQGFEAAQVSAACILYLLPRNFEVPPRTTVERKQLAISYYVRAFKQGNIDAGVVAGDIYYRMGDFSKAIQLYQSSAFKFSPQALWDLGYMYEHGLGVEKDFHMAKRYYDQVLENNSKLYVAVKLSVLKLRLKSWLSWIQGNNDGFGLEPSEETIDLTKKETLFQRLVSMYQSAFKQNGEESRIDIENTQTMGATEVVEEENISIWDSLVNRSWLSSESLHSLFFFFLMFCLTVLIGIIFRTVGAAMGWNVRDDNRIHINGQRQAGGMFHNFEIQIAI